MKGYAVKVIINSDSFNKDGFLKEEFIQQLDNLTQDVDKRKIKYALIDFNVVYVIFFRLLDAKLFYNKAKKELDIIQDIQKVEFKK